MKPDDKLDEIFREGLSSVDLPPPPSQDWAAMARAARTNAVLAGKGQGSAGMAHWLKLLGGAAAVGVACYLIFSPQMGTPVAGTAPRVAEAPVVPTKSAPARSEDIPQGTVGQELIPDPVTSTSLDNPPPQASEGHVRSPEEDASRAGSSAITSLPTPRMVTAPQPTSPAVPMDVENTAPLPSSARAPELAAAQATGEVEREAAIAPEQGALPVLTMADATQHIAVRSLQLLQPVPTPLLYQPVMVAASDLGDYVHDMHWSVAPWMSVGWSTYVDADDGSAAPAGLESPGNTPWSFGVRVQYALDPNLAFITGIGLANKGPLEGWVTSSPTMRTEYHLSGQYIEIPLAAKGTITVGRTELYARGGLTLQFNRPGGENKVVVHDEDLKQMSTLTLAGSSMGSAIDIGAGAQFRLLPCMSFFVEPSYQYGLSPAVKHPSFDQLPFNPRIHTFSLITGLSIQFR